MRTSKINWRKFEDTLFKLTVAELRGVGERNPDKKFYGFAFDCHSDYGQVLLCLNTEEALKKQAERYATDPPNASAWAKIDASMNAHLKAIIGKERFEKLGGEVFKPAPRKSAKEYEKSLRWAVGDWGYPGFQSPAFERGWARFQDLAERASVEAERDPNPINQQFMISVCRVMVRLEKGKAFAVLSRTRNFKTWVGDHDELDSQSQARLKSVRAGYRKKWRVVRRSPG